MNIRKNSLTAAVFILLLFTAFGCGPNYRRNNGPAAQQNSSAVKRFQEPALQGRTAVESAIELSQKYAELSDQAVALRGKNQDLTAENEQLKEQVTSLGAKLQQTQKELTEANNLLIQMLAELNNWKSNILGFRNEMRDASKAELEALLKVLEILGGQPTTQPPNTTNEEQPTPANPNQPSTRQSSSKGEPNE
jgi:chromosome segregation ATPase